VGRAARGAFEPKDADAAVVNFPSDKGHEAAKISAIGGKLPSCAATGASLAMMMKFFRPSLEDGLVG
jgi:hypothetical protein